MSKLTVQQAIDLATDNGVIVTDHFRKRSNGKTSNAFKVGFRGGVMITCIQVAKGSRQWRADTKYSTFLGSQAEFIEWAIKELTN